MLRKKILLTDDAELLQALEGSFFRRAGFTLLVADSGERVFEMIEEQDPVLAILALDMPDRQGDAICRRVKQDAILRSTPIILVVDAGGEEVASCCREAGCDDILRRPIDSQQLLTAACRVLNIIERSGPRVETRFPVHCGRDPRKLQPAWVLNINAGGLFVEIERLHPVNTLVTLEFTLPGHTSSIRCKGRVAWVNHPEWIKTSSLPSGMGIQFLDLAEEAALAIREHVEKKTSDG
ncbi:MAG TPA: response regulator [Desulfuromonadales bacterium]|nr:response regulator [Desulfuromonadales bacterium]